MRFNFCLMIALMFAHFRSKIVAANDLENCRQKCGPSYSVVRSLQIFNFKLNGFEFAAQNNFFRQNGKKFSQKKMKFKI